MKLIQVSVANSSLAFTFLPLVFLSLTSEKQKITKIFSFFFRLLSIRLCACLLAEVTMTENTKLCDFSNTNCRGFVTADVLVKGLSTGAISPWWRLKGIEQERHGDLPRFGPSEEVKAYVLL